MLKEPLLEIAWFWNGGNLPFRSFTFQKSCISSYIHKLQMWWC